MKRRPIAIFFLILVTLFASACSQEAKKKRAIEGGNKYFEKGQFKQARLMYLNAIKTDPRFGEAYYKLALTNLQLGSPGEAVGNLQRTIELQPENLDAYSKLADLYLAAFASSPAKSKHVMTEVQSLVDRMAKREKGTFEEIRLRGFIAIAESRTVEGLDLFRKAEKMHPDDMNLKLSIARSLMVLKQFDEAKEYVNGILAKKKDLDTGYDILYNIALVQRNFDEAESVLRRRIESNPKVIVNHLRLAAHHFSTRKLPEMEKVLSSVLARHSELTGAYMEVGDFYYRIRDFDRAATTYQEGIKTDAARKRNFEKKLVEVRVAQGRPAEALELCEKLLAEDSKDPEAIAMRASLWLYAGKPDQINAAIGELQSVVNKMPENFVLRYNLGRALMSKGDLDGARVQFADALRFRANYLPARVALAQIQVARGEFNAALSGANEILQEDPNNQPARIIMSDAFLSQNKLDDAKNVLATALKTTPDFADAKYRMGYILFRERKLKEAEAYFRELYAQNPPDLRGLMGLTEVFAVQNQFDDSLKVIAQAQEKFPKALALKAAQGNILLRAKRYPEGIAAYSTILESDPKNFEIHMKLAEGYRLNGEMEKAIETWKKAGALMPNDVGPLMGRAMALGQLNRSSEAAPLYEQILKVAPDNVPALNNYSFYLAEQGNNLDLALSYAQKAKAKAPTDPMVADTLGYIYLKKNLPQSATPIFVELTGKHPTVALFHVRLATAYLQSGKKDQAKTALADARKNNPTPSDKEEIEKLAGKLG